MFLRQILVFILAALGTAGLARAAEKVVYIVSDTAGSPVAEMDEQGAVLLRRSFKPYGGEQNPLPGNLNHSYTGKPFDADTGLLYMGARMYDPETARFAGVDPQGFKEGKQESFGRYVYANNSPYVYVDPNGEYADLVIEGVSFALNIKSFGENVDAGRYGDATADAASMLVDGVLSAIPLIPGATGALRHGDELLKRFPEIKTNDAQAANLERFAKKLPENAKDDIQLKSLPDGGVAAQATSPGRVPGSKAVYEKQVDSSGKTIQYTKTTYGPDGEIVHVKDKLPGGGTYP